VNECKCDEKFKLVQGGLKFHEEKAKKTKEKKEILEMDGSIRYDVSH